MTLTIEIAPETQRAIEGKARRLGVPVERYAAGVLRRDVENEEPRVLNKQGAAFLALLDKARPIVAAGTLRPLTSESVNAAIDTTRDRENHHIEYSNE
jgi:hypothetical protein